MAKISEFIQDQTMNEESFDRKIDKVMSKVGKGEELTASEQKTLEYVLDRQKEKESSSSKTQKIMKKVRNGEDLTASEQKTLSRVLDRSKEAQNESVEELDEAQRIGDSELKRLAGQVKELVDDVPTGKKINNRLAKLNTQRAKNLQSKLAKAQKLVDEYKETKGKIDPLKDDDYKGRKALKQKFQRLYSQLNKYQGLRQEAERVMADLEKKGQEKQQKEQGKQKKKEFKQRVKQNLDRKRKERTEKSKEKMKKGKEAAKKKFASYAG